MRVLQDWLLRSPNVMYLNFCLGKANCQKNPNIFKIQPSPEKR